MEELFDVLDEEGRPTGRSEPRSLVHRRGLWHRAFHLFIVGRIEGRVQGLFQLRSDRKDVSPGKLDVAVGGHYRAGETLPEVVREAEEEIGLCVAPGELTFFETQRAVHAAAGIVDRELQEVYLFRRDVPARAYRPDPEELAGLFTVPLDALCGLLEGRARTVQGSGVVRSAGAWVEAARAFGREDLIEDDRENLLRVTRAALAFMARE